MKTKTVSPLHELMGIDANGAPVTFSDVCDSPFQAWGKIKIFSHQGALCYFMARLYRRDIEEHDFFKVKNKAVIDKSIPFQEVKQCH